MTTSNDTVGLGGPSPGPQAGVTESGASQAKREAAFYAVAQAWGLAEYLPECHLLLIGGREYAALKLLGSSYEDLNAVRARDPGAPRRLFLVFRPDGTLHRWAALDAILGNVDRNAGNLMVRGDEVKLIDHGSAFAGTGFAPATDKNTFVPYYLRALAPSDFNQLAPADKLRALPRISGDSAKNLNNWLSSLDEEGLARILHRFGIEAKPSVERLRSLKGALAYQPADLAINSFWVL